MRDAGNTGALLSRPNSLSLTTCITDARPPTPCRSAAPTHPPLQPLLALLGEQPFGTSRDAWLNAVQRPLEVRSPWGRRQLMALLRRVMIR